MHTKNYELLFVIYSDKECGKIVFPPYLLIVFLIILKALVKILMQ
jgi:hypothetical protein